MKNLFFMLLTVLIVSCNAGTAESEQPKGANEVKSVGVTSMAFDETTHDFGTIYSGEILEFTYNFTNTGKFDLQLVAVHADCGCTTPQFSTDAIAPGKTGTIKVRFDSKGFSGNVYKSIKVTANTEPAEQFLYLVADIK